MSRLQVHQWFRNKKKRAKTRFGSDPVPPFAADKLKRLVTCGTVTVTRGNQPIEKKGGLDRHPGSGNSIKNNQSAGGHDSLPPLLVTKSELKPDDGNAAGLGSVSVTPSKTAIITNKDMDEFGHLEEWVQPKVATSDIVQVVHDRDLAKIKDRLRSANTVVSAVPPSEPGLLTPPAGTRCGRYKFISTHYLIHFQQKYDDFEFGNQIFKVLC